MWKTALTLLITRHSHSKLSYGEMQEEKKTYGDRCRVFSSSLKKSWEYSTYENIYLTCSTILSISNIYFLSKNHDYSDIHKTCSFDINVICLCLTNEIYQAFTYVCPESKKFESHHTCPNGFRSVSLDSEAANASQMSCILKREVGLLKRKKTRCGFIEYNNEENNRRDLHILDRINNTGNSVSVF